MAGATRKSLKITVPGVDGGVSGLMHRPANAFCLYVFAHGAGAGMRHAFMEDLSARLFDAEVATLRFNFPFIEARKRRPDTPRLLIATVRAAVKRARSLTPGLPLVAGGKSMGGRMTSQAAAAEPLDGVAGLVFVGFPLHAPGRTGTSRADHLRDVQLPMLFVQGTRDALADIDLMRDVSRGLGRRGKLHVVDGGDHSFKVLKRSGRDAADVMSEVVTATVGFARRLTR